MGKRELWAIKSQERKPLREMVYERLKRRIQRGEIKAHERLIEQDLAAEMGLSRTPVREAISKLEQEGLINKIPQRGAVVRGTTKEEIEEVFGLRMVLESYAASLTTERIDEEILQQLDAMLDKQRRTLEQGNVNRYIQLNTQFHDLIYRESKSDKLYQMINNLRDYFYKYRVLILKLGEMPTISLQDHTNMVQAMRERDAHKVEALVKEHILRGRERILWEIEEGRLSLE